MRGLLCLCGLVLTPIVLGDTTRSILDDEVFSAAIERDVVVLGGGASGSHAALRLRDQGKSVLLIEKQAHLGGHVSTHVDPATNKPYDYGVYSFIDYTSSKSFFARFNISISPVQRPTTTTLYADFATGKNLTGIYTPPPSAAVTAAYKKYLELCEKYEPMILPSYDNFPALDAIPDDLLMSFGDFAVKHGIEAAVPNIYQITASGTGNMLERPALVVMQTFGAPMVRIFLGLGSQYVPSSLSNIDLYRAIEAELGADVFASSKVVGSRREATGVKLAVRNSKTDKITLVKAKKLLVAFEPTLGNAAALDLDEMEMEVFARWQHSRLYCGIVTHPSLPVNFSIPNTPEAMVPTNYLGIPRTPFVNRIEYMGGSSNYFRFTATGDDSFTPEQVKALVAKNIDALIKAGAIPQSEGEGLQFVAFADHEAMHMGASAEHMSGGFMQRLLELQGRRSTWYTGAAWSAHFQTIIWEFNERLVPRIVNSL